MKISTLILSTSILILFHTPCYSVYQWYDVKGNTHFTQDVPPPDAKKKDGSSWWEIENTQEKKEKELKKRIQRARQRIKSERKKQTKPSNQKSPAKEDDSEKPEREEAESEDKAGFFERLAKFFSKKDKAENCIVPWLVEKHGICPLDDEEPNMDEIGNEFKAVVVNNRKCVWSSCRGTYNGDILKFVYKGDGYWETDGNKPECPYYEGFRWE